MMYESLATRLDWTNSIRRRPREGETITSMMRLAVCVKCVPPVSSPRRLDPATGRLVRGSLVLNAPDLHALEAALRLRDEAGEAEVVVVSVGGERAAAALRDTLALGADRCLLVGDERIAGSDLLATSRVLAAALERCSADLILLGQEASDANGALLWAALAERLRLPAIARAGDLRVADGLVTATQTTDGGTQRVRASVPCVISVAAAANRPRHAALKDVVAARSKSCELVALGELGIDARLVGVPGSGTTVRAVREPAAVRGGRIVDASDTGAAVVLDLLAERELL